MTRSIHKTRRDLAELEATDFGRAERRESALARTRERLAQKRRIKAAVLEERRRPAAGVTAAELVPVVVTETGDHMHHAATVEDVREVLRRLPPGVVDGLTRVELQLGAEYQVEHERRDPGNTDPDPLVGRLGYEGFPGVWGGRVLGVYSPDTAVIHLNAYVFRDDAPLRDVWEIMLKLEALSTLVHEVGHHYDHTARVARGRWLANGKERVERYAEDRQHVWLHGVVVPYLREAYPAEVERVEAWVEHEGGVRLPLETLADDPRATRKGGFIDLNATLWAMSEFLHGLARDAVQGTPVQDRRVGFACDLHYRDMYEEAHRGLDRVLAEEPAHLEALTLRADILVHQERHQEALQIALGVLGRVPDHAPAWEVVADAYEGMGRWQEAHAAASRLIELYADDGWRRYHALVQRAKAAMRLGDLAGARADFARLDAEYPKRMQAKWVERLRTKLDAATAAAAGDQNTSTT